jgi:hypothetical protein
MKKIKRIFTKIKSYFSVIIFFLILALFSAIALPRIAFEIGDFAFSIDGLDFPEVTNNTIPLELEFSPSLDFYGGSEVVYQSYDLQSISNTSIETTGYKLKTLLANIGIQDTEIYLRENVENSNQEIVVKMPKTEEELLLFNELLSLGSEISFANQDFSQNTDTQDPTAAQQPQYLPTLIEKSDIESVELIYGADTYGYGLVINFKQDAFAKVYTSSITDQTPSQENQLLLLLSGQPIAGQVYPLSSSSRQAKMVFATGLGEDRLSALLLKEMVATDNLPQNLVATSVTKLPGRFDHVAEYIKLGFALTLFALGAILIFKLKRLGLSLMLNLTFVLVTTVALLKFAVFFNRFIEVNLSIAGIVGLFVAIVIWIFNSMKLIKTIQAKKDYENELSVSKNRIKAILIFTTLMFIILNGLNISAINDFSTFFAFTMLISWISYYTCVPISLNFIEGLPKPKKQDEKIKKN